AGPRLLNLLSSASYNMFIFHVVRRGSPGASRAVFVMSLLNALQSLLGPAYVLTGTDAGEYLQDWRRRYRGAALAVIRPGSTEQVAQAIRLCIEHGVPVVPQGGN